MYSLNPSGFDVAVAVHVGKEGAESGHEASGAAVQLVGGPLVVEAGRDAIEHGLGLLGVAGLVRQGVVVEEVGCHTAHIDVGNISLIEPAIGEPSLAERVELTLEALLEQVLPLGQREGRVVLADRVLNELAPSAVVKGGADIVDLGGPVVTAFVILEEGVVALALHGSDEVEEVIHFLGSAELGVEAAEGVAVIREEVAVVEADIGVGRAKSANIIPEGASVEGTMDLVGSKAASISLVVSKFADDAGSNGLNHRHIFGEVDGVSRGSGECLGGGKALGNNTDFLAVLFGYGTLVNNFVDHGSDILLTN